jgi:phosphoribosylanthranilate isomerase
MTMIKICGMRDREAVRASVDAGANAIGFVFAESVRRVTPHEARDMAVEIPQTVRKVAVMLHPDNEEWQQVFEIFRPDVLQTDASDFSSLDVSSSIEKWPVLREGKLEVNGLIPETFVYEGKSSGVGEQVDWQVAAGLALRGRMILAGGLSARNVAHAIGEVRPYGVDVSSAVESEPGQKDAGKIKEFIDAARCAEKESS